MSDSFYYTVLEINRYSGVPGILFFLLFVRGDHKYSKIVFFILLASFLADFSNFFFIRYVYQNSYIISNSWYLLNFVLVCWYFYELIPKKRNFTLFVLILFAAVSFLSFLFVYSYMEPNTIVKSLTSVSFSILSLVCLFEILRESPTDQLRNYPVFWVVSAIFLYSTITLFRNLFQNYLVIEIGGHAVVWRYVAFFNLLFNIIKNILFFYSFVLVKRGFPDFIHEPKLTTK